MSIFILYLLLWAAMNFFLVPRIIIPAVFQGIKDFNRTNPVKISVKHIYFHPLKGFQLEGISVSQTTGTGKEDIIRAASADIDIFYPSLLQKRVEISSIDIDRADLFISRKTKGIWNFRQLLDLRPMGAKTAGPLKLVVKYVRITGSRIFYSDHYRKNNSIERIYHSMEASVASRDGRKYIFILKGTDDKYKEAAAINCLLDIDTKEMKAHALLKTAVIGQYWDYYLDDIFKPWNFKAGEVEADISLSSAGKKLDIKGSYSVNRGAVGFGDFKLSCDAKIEHEQEIDLSKRSSVRLKGKVQANNISAYAGKERFLTKGTLLASATERLVIFEKITGSLKNGPVDLKGNFRFAPPPRLELNGHLGDSNDSIILTLFSDNSGVIDWTSSSEAAYMKVKASSGNLKDLFFSVDIDADVNLTKITDKIELRLGDKKRKMRLLLNGADFNGRIMAKGTLKGEADKLDRLSGRLGLRLDDLSVMGLPPASFVLGMRASNGLFEAGIPNIDYYGGTLAGAVIMDSKRWGITLDVKECNIAELGKISPDFKGLKGIFTGNMSAVAGWENLSSMKGGGYFMITDCDFSKAPFFDAITQGMRDVSKGFVMPEFGKVEGNYEIGGSAVSFENVKCEDKSLSLNISGKYLFTGEMDFTVGLRFFKTGFWNTMRQILLPITISFDILSEGVRVNLTGRWPDLNQSASVQPMTWFSRVFSKDVTYDPEKYKIKDLWD